MGNDIGKRIADKRRFIGMTQEELAKKIGYTSKTTIAKIESGVNDIPQSKIVLLAKVLGTTPAVLMGWEDEEKLNNAIASVVVRLRTDAQFQAIIEKVQSLDEAKLSLIEQLLTTITN